eukprot:COSAG05_NODE_629_length_8215_cov_26.328241_3_plen_76_part_00
MPADARREPPPQDAGHGQGTARTLRTPRAYTPQLTPTCRIQLTPANPLAGATGATQTAKERSGQARGNTATDSSR